MGIKYCPCYGYKMIQNIEIINPKPLLLSSKYILFYFIKQVLLSQEQFGQILLHDAVWYPKAYPQKSFQRLLLE